ncbi:MAG: ABC transporter permease [Clostridiaceae bacterium]
MNSITFLVFKKEIVDLFRDKKTVFMAIIIPLIIFPVIFGVMGKAMESSEKSVENNMKIAIQGDVNSSLYDYIKGQEGIKLVESENINKDVKKGDVLAAVIIPDGFDNNIDEENMPKLEIIYDNSSQSSMIVEGKISSYIQAYSNEIIVKRLGNKGIDVSILTPIESVYTTVEEEESGMGKFMISLLLPLMVVLYSVTGPLAAATDLGAGEKERGTIEPLLTTKASRMSLLWGKFLAITVMGLLTNISALLGLMIASTQTSGFFGEGASFSLDTKTILLIGLIAILTTMVFGALELSISIFARSFKEAQTYLSPLTIIALIPTYATYMLDGKNIPSFYFHIPLSNVVCLIKEFINGVYNYNHIFITFGWTIIYILASILLARFMFNREEVIFRT